MRLALLALVSVCASPVLAETSKTPPAKPPSSVTEEDDDMQDFTKIGVPIEQDDDADESSDPDEDVGDQDEDASLKDAPVRTGTAKASPAGPPTLQLDGTGTPLADNFAAKVVAVEKDAVVIELPVLVGRSRADATATGFWVIVEAWISGAKVVESRQLVTATSLASAGPSFVFAKLWVPVPDRVGTLELKVSRADSLSGAAKPLFSRTLDWSLPTAP